MDSDCLRNGCRPDPARSGRQPQSARRQRNRRDTIDAGGSAKIGAVTARTASQRARHGSAVNRDDPALAEATLRAVLPPGRTLGLEFHVLNATSEHDFDGVFAKCIELQVGALVIGGAPLFTSNSEQLAVLAARHRVPTVYKGREFAAAGGLLSYGSDIADAYRLAGNYSGRISRATSPATCQSSGPQKSRCT